MSSFNNKAHSCPTNKHTIAKRSSSATLQQCFTTMGHARTYSISTVSWLIFLCSVHDCSRSFRRVWTTVYYTFNSTRSGVRRLEAYKLWFRSLATNKCRHTGQQCSSTRTRTIRSTRPLELLKCVRSDPAFRNTDQGTAISHCRCQRAGQVEQVAASQRLSSNKDRVLRLLH